MLSQLSQLELGLYSEQKKKQIKIKETQMLLSRGNNGNLRKALIKQSTSVQTMMIQ